MMRKTMSLILFAVSAASTNTAQAALTCIEVGQFVEGTAQARDQQQQQSRLIAIINEDSSFSISEKKTLKKYVELVYENKDLPPKALANIAIETCYQSALKK